MFLIPRNNGYRYVTHPPQAVGYQKQMKDEEGRDTEKAEAGELITMPVLTKVRRHDKVMVEL